MRKKDNVQCTVCRVGNEQCKNQSEDSSSKVLVMNVISTPLNVVSAAIFSFR